MSAVWQARLLRVTFLLVLQSETARFFVKAVSFLTEQPSSEGLASHNDWLGATTQSGFMPTVKRQDGISQDGNDIQNTGLGSVSLYLDWSVVKPVFSSLR